MIFKINGQIAEKIPADLIRIMPAKEGPKNDPVSFFMHCIDQKNYKT
jgi:hypothetical protein